MESQSHHGIWGIEIQNKDRVAPEGLSWVSGVKFTHLLEGGHELLQMFPSQMKY